MHTPSLQSVQDSKSPSFSVEYQGIRSATAMSTSRLTDSPILLRINTSDMPSDLPFVKSEGAAVIHNTVAKLKKNAPKQSDSVSNPAGIANAVPFPTGASTENFVQPLPALPTTLPKKTSETISFKSKETDKPSESRYYFTSWGDDNSIQILGDSKTGYHLLPSNEQVQKNIESHVKGQGSDLPWKIDSVANSSDEQRRHHRPQPDNDETEK